MDEGKEIKTPQVAEGLTTSEKLTADEFTLSEWISLDKRVRELQTLQDLRLVQLAKDFDAWRENQTIELIEKPNEAFITYYKSKDAQGREVALGFRTSKNRLGGLHFRIIKFLTQSNTPAANARAFLGSYEDGVLMMYPHPSSLEGIQIEPSRINDLRDSIGIGYSREKRPPSGDFEDVKNSWGMAYYLRPGMTERISKFDEDANKRADPIDKGREFLDMLKSAELLGRFDDSTNSFVEPPKKASSIPPPASP